MFCLEFGPGQYFNRGGVSFHLHGVVVEFTGMYIALEIMRCVHVPSGTSDRHFSTTSFVAQLISTLLDHHKLIKIHTSTKINPEAHEILRNCHATL